MDHRVVGYTMFRLFMGLNMFMHGAVRVGGNYGTFIEWTHSVFVDTWIPHWLVSIEAALIPPVELAIGTLLLLGFQTRIAIIAGFVLMCTLVFGMNIVQNWELVNRHLLYALAFWALMHNLEHNQFSLDGRN